MKFIISFGNWIFRYRNIIFPLFYLALFIPSSNICPERCAVISGGLAITSGILVRSVTIGLEYIIRGGRYGKIHANSLVTGGIYSICRNPMYLGNILLIFGFGIFANSLLFTVLFFPLFLIVYYAIIKAEETFLTDKFGEEYTRYKANVKSIIPDLTKINLAFKGYKIRWKRVLIREYNSLYLYFTGIELLLYYKHTVDLKTTLLLFAITTILYALMKILKKTIFRDYAKNVEK